MKEVIDFHTHIPKLKENIIKIFIPPFKSLGPSKEHYYCLGIHPWDISNSPDNQLNKLDRILKLNHKDKYFFGLGEMGLDKLKISHASLEIQIKVLKAQICLAKKYKINTLVLHIVKSYQEVFMLLKDSGFKGNLILHGFTGNTQIFEQYNRYWNTYISLSKDLIEKVKFDHLFRSIGADKILIETDDKIHQSIEETFKIFVKKAQINSNILLDIHHKNLKLLRQN